MKDKRQRLALSWPYWDPFVVPRPLPPSSFFAPLPLASDPHSHQSFLRPHHFVLHSSTPYLASKLMTKHGLTSVPPPTQVPDPSELIASSFLHHHHASPFSYLNSTPPLFDSLMVPSLSKSTDNSSATKKEEKPSDSLPTSTKN